MSKNGVRATGYKTKKLVADFRKREKYVCHIANLQYYLKHGNHLFKNVLVTSLFYYF